jgi:hypothetical protein
MTVTALQIGLHPDVIDHPAPDFAAFKGLTKEGLRAANDENLARLREAGYEADGCQIDFGETALGKVRTMLDRTRYDAVLIGAGVRLAVGNTLLFEPVINLVHTALPHALFLFNMNAEAAPDDIRRPLRPAGPGNPANAPRSTA